MSLEKNLAGIDEVGRGALAGPVVAAAVILPEDFDTSPLRDSKKLTPKQRETLSLLIREKALFGIGSIAAERIDTIGIKKATHEAMLLAIKALSKTPDALMIDGNDHFSFAIPNECIIKGDDKIPAIAAASIVAKVFRDELMIEYAEQHAAYGFEKHKGYGSALHMRMIEEHGPCPLHRMSWKPLQQPKLFSLA